MRQRERDNRHIHVQTNTVPGRLVRKPHVQVDVTFNSLLINCRSLVPKMSSLSENFKMNNSTVALLTETWFSKGNKKVAHELKILAQRDGISFLRRDRNTREGGVALAYDSSRAEFKKLSLKSLKGKDLEILVGKGKVHGVKKSHIVITCYVPPSYTRAKDREFFDVLTDAISESRSLFPDAWVTVGGDWNGRNLDDITRLFPDLSVVDSPPTRKNATLDVLINNYPQYCVGVAVNHALESEDGKLSDHGILQVDSILPRPRAFVWEVHQYLKTS